jgi:ribose transport system ATP-binding protein
MIGVSDAAARPPVLEMRGIVKRFPGVVALDGVNFSVEAGEVHLLLGENGAGKSTLVKILAGVHRMDAGEIRIDGRPVDIASPLAARRLGIAMIHQETNLVPGLTVAENVFLGREPVRFGLVDRKRMEAETAEWLAQLHGEVRPDALVRNLPVAKQQLVEIAKALALDARILVLDEPTAPLSRRETDDLFAIIRRLAAAGTAIVYITHRLEEGRAIGHRVTVLRDGGVAGTGALAELNDAAIVALMVGREMTGMFPDLPRPDGPVRLRVSQLERAGAFGPVSFEVRGGEILGVAGLVGSGRTEMARCLAGADRATGGTVEVDGAQVRLDSPRAARQAGICLLPEDRKAQGLVLGLPVLHNVSLASLEQVSRFGFLDLARERARVSALTDRLRVRTPSLDRPVRILSGGNQQKVVLAKWLAVGPKVILFDEPTRGVDVGARFEVYTLMCELAAQGVAVVMISSDLAEVLGMSHRVAVMHRGRIAAVLPRAEASPEQVMHYAMGLAPD